MGAAALITLAATGATAFLQVQQARAQNKAISRAQASQQKAAGVQQRQLVEQAAVERRRIQDQTQQIEGRLRVAAGESGVGLGGSTAALGRQAQFDQASNLSILGSNLGNEQARVQSGLEANLANLSANQQNPLLAGLMGGLGGLQTGLSISSGISSIQRLDKTPEPKLNKAYTIGGST